MLLKATCIMSKNVWKPPGICSSNIWYYILQLDIGSRYYIFLCKIKPVLLHWECNTSNNVRKIFKRY